MNCQAIQENLALYIDNAVSADVRTMCEEHLAHCPLCREEVAALRFMRAELRAFKRPAMPADLIFAVRQSVAVEIAAQQRQPKLTLGQRFTNFMLPRLMPYSVGTLASILLFSLMFTGLWASISAVRNWQQVTRTQENEEIKVLAINKIPNNRKFDDEITITPEEYVEQRQRFTSESPSLNPTGTFVSLTSSLVHGRATKEDAVVIVADVFSDGIAKIADVVESRDSKSLEELEKLLREEPVFVPSSLDQRPENVRVIFRVLKVDVDENTQKQKRFFKRPFIGEN
jgi:hypothetical protein